jgi:hypothetical protein
MAPVFTLAPPGSGDAGDVVEDALEEDVCVDEVCLAAEPVEDLETPEGPRIEPGAISGEPIKKVE